MKDVRLSGYVPGAIGRVAELHGKYYHEHWGFDLFFESKVATELSEFLCRLNKVRDGFWVAMVEERMVGSIAIDGVHFDTQGAHLRWFIVAPENQEQGIGKLCLKKPSNSVGEPGSNGSIFGLLQDSIERAIFMRSSDSNFPNSMRATNGEKR